MAQSTIRFAAGAGVVAASLLVLGPFPAEAAADKNGSGSHSKHDDRGNRSTKPRSGPPSPGRNLINDIRDGLNAIEAPKPSIDPPPMDLGTGGSDFEDLAVPDSVESFAVTDSPVALRSATVVDVPSVNASGAVPRSGSGYSGPPAASIRAPDAVVGNGRTPAPQVRNPDAVLVSGRETPAMPEAVPEAIEINVPPLPPPLPPVERIQRPRLVVGEVGTAKVDTMTDPLAGLAGLILIPAVGAALGYRQARAAQSLRESART